MDASEKTPLRLLSYLELVASKRHRAHGDAVRERLLRRAHPTVGDGTGGAFEHGRMGNETLDVSVRRDLQTGQLARG